MQEVIYNSKLNLSEHFPAHLFKNLFKVFPRLNSTIPKNIISNAQPILIEKFLFYRMILEKVKNYFEMSESFVMSESIEIILKDLRRKNKEKIKKIETEFPIINNKKENINLQSYSTKSSPRSYSTKNSRNTSIDIPKSNQENKITNKEKLNINTSKSNLNQVFLNFEINKNSKMKLVRFAENSPNNSNKPKVLSKKSNLKPISNGSKKALTMKISNQNKTLTNNISIDINEKNKLLIQTKTEYSFRNKSTKPKKIQINAPKESKEIISPDRIKNIYENNVKNFINIEDKNFNIFEFESKVRKENTLLLISKYIFNYFKFGEIVTQSKFDNWVEKIAKGYNRNNLYHHDLHAADVAHTAFIFFKYGLIHETAKLDNSMVCAVIISCICHDYKHPGINNNYLIDTDDDIALNYNDISVLENMHVSEAFKLMHTNPNYNVFEGLEREKYKKMRKQIITCVLSTDMSKHNLSISFLEKILSNINKPEDNDKQEYMNTVVHSSDISNPTKVFDIYTKWALLIIEEFFIQGDKEKRLGLKCSCDRDKVTIYQNQLGFIDFFEIPFFSLLTKAFPKLDFLMVNINNNKQRVKQLEEEFNKNKNKKL